MKERKEEREKERERERERKRKRNYIVVWKTGHFISIK